MGIPWWEQPKVPKSELEKVREEVARLQVVMNVISMRSKFMATVVEELVAQVAANRSVVQSAVLALEGLHAALEAAVATGDMTQVAAAVADLKSNTDALAAGIAANTEPAA